MPSSHRILVIEDNLDVSESLKLVLEIFGHTVAVAYSGEDGLAQAAAFSPNVVLCDIGLPTGMSGFGVARAMRERNHKAHLVALTGHGGDEVAREAREAGFDRHMVKPVDPVVLRKMLEQV